MEDRRGSLFGAALIAFVLCFALLPAVAASATVGHMEIMSDTTLTEDHSGEIVISGDVITLDCAGYKVTGIGSGVGIEIVGVGVTVRNCDVSGFEDGIVLGDGGGATVEKNRVHDNDIPEFSVGIGGSGSSNNTIRDNVVERNGFDGIQLVSHSDGNTIAGNTASGNGRSGIALVESINNAVSDNVASGNYEFGISLGLLSDSNSVYRNVADTNGVDGFHFALTTNNTITGNTATANRRIGFFAPQGIGNSFTGNEAHINGHYGMWVNSGDDFDGNYCTGNGLGSSTPYGVCQEEHIGLVDASTGMWHLRHNKKDVTSFYYGNPGDVPFLGDWDCDGIATPGLFRTSDAFAYLRNSNTQGAADIRFFFGNPSDIPLAGDFDGDGCDTVSLYRPSEQRFYIINKLGEDEGGLGAAEYSFLFGSPGDRPVVGDWDGDGIDEIGLHRETTGFFYYRNTLTTGVADGQFYFGIPGDRFVAGDWGVVDGVETPAMFRPSDDTIADKFYFRWTLTQGIADSRFAWPGAEMNWLPVSGDFTSD